MGSHGIRSAGQQHKRRLYLVLGLTGLYLLAEVVGGFLTGSLALLADAGHMLTDVLGLAMSILAITLGERVPTPERTFGYLRAEILAALVNAVLLIAVAIAIFYEAYGRIQHPPEILSTWMLGVAAVGLVVNLSGMFLLHAGAGESLNVRGAYLEVLGDTLGSVGVIVAAVIIMLTGWRLADPIIGVGIGLFILPRAWHLLRQSVDVLLEATPRHIDLREMRRSLEQIEGVIEIHDLHAWTITSGLDAVACHVVIENLTDGQRVLETALKLLHDRYQIEHATLQIEPPGLRNKLQIHD